MRTMTAKQAASFFRACPKRMEQKIIRAEAKTLGDAQKFAVTFSSGGISTSQLSMMGHPYATREPRPPNDPGIINDQGGMFVHAWVKLGPSTNSSTIDSTLENVAPYSGYMRGTKLMIPRPIWELITKAVRGIRQHRLETAVEDALSGR